jgi:ABC-type sugar transport system ATPase subunit
MPAIELSGISNSVLRDISLSVRDGECLVLAGATGAGKTTLLNVIAGLVAYRGTVRFGGTAVDGLPPARRKVGYLFKSFALFPHMRVADSRLTAELPEHIWHETGLGVSDSVHVEVPLGGIRILTDAEPA